MGPRWETSPFPEVQPHPTDGEKDVFPECCEFRIIAEFGGIGIDWTETDYREPGACLPQNGNAYEGKDD